MSTTGTVGTIVGWERSYNGGAFSSVAGNQSTYSEVPGAVGVYEYRTIVQSGVCSTTTSSINQFITVSGSGGLISGGNSPVCLGGSTGTLTLTGVAGSIAKWQYSSDNGTSWTDLASTAGTSSYNYTGLNVAATWQFRASITGVGFSGARSIEVDAIPGISSSSKTDITNCNVSDGSITINATGGTGTLEYSINGSTWQTGNQSTSLPDATYLPMVRNQSSPQCSVAGTGLTITTPSAPGISSASKSDISNCNVSDGSITINASGGTGTLEYSINGTVWQTTNTFPNLTATNYQPTTRNQGSVACSISGSSITLTTPSAPGISNTTKTDISSCGLSDGSITINATGGTGTLEYSINGSTWQISNVFNGLPTNNYQPTTRNQSSVACSIAGTSLTITVPGAPTISSTTKNDISNCGVTDGSITINASGGTGTLEYSLNGTLWQTSNVFTGLTTNNYQPATRNQSSPACSFTGSSVTITTPSAPTVSGLTHTDISNCGPLNDGTITLSAGGGSGPLEYSSDGVSWQNTGNFTGLSASSYTPQVRNANSPGCMTSGNVVIGVPAIPTITGMSKTDINNCNVNNGSITIQASGGTGTLEYSLNGSFWQVSGNFTGLSAGSSTPRVRNQGSPGCNSSGSSVTITAPGAPAISSSPSTNTSSCVLNDGKVTINASGGTGTLEYSLNGTVWTTNPQSTNLAVATYLPMVRNQGSPSCSVAGTSVNVGTSGSLSSVTLSFSKNIYCSSDANPTPTPSQAYAGATFAVTTGTLANAATGTLDLLQSLGSASSQQVTVRYNIPATGGCAPASPTATITINKLPTAASVSYPQEAYCSDGGNPAPTSAPSSGGSFSSPTANVSLDTQNGIIDLANTPARGPIRVIYNASVAGCAATPTLLNITITGAPVQPAISYSSPVCSGSTVNPTGSYSSGIFSSEGDLNIDAQSGKVTAAKAGTYIITYTIAENGGCPAGQDTASLTIKESTGGTAQLSTPKEQCEGNQAIMNLNGEQGTATWQQQQGDGRWHSTTTSGESYTSGLLYSTSYYRAKVVNSASHACPEAYSNTLTVTVSTLPKAGTTDSTSYTFCDSFSGEVRLSQEHGSIQWQESARPDSLYSNINNPTATSEDLKVYLSGYGEVKYVRAQITSSPVCPVTYTGVVKVQMCKRSDFVPNALTPNTGDQNSVWNLSGMKLLDYAEIRIFNRYGVEVYYATGQQMKSSPWDGGGMPAGTYYYLIDRKDGSHAFTGAVTVVK